MHAVQQMNDTELELHKKEKIINNPYFKKHWASLFLSSMTRKKVENKISGSCYTC